MIFIRRFRGFILRPLQEERGRLAREFKTKHHADEPSALQPLAAFCGGSFSLFLICVYLRNLRTAFT